MIRLIVWSMEPITFACQCNWQCCFVFLCRFSLLWFYTIYFRPSFIFLKCLLYYSNQRFAALQYLNGNLRVCLLKTHFGFSISLSFMGCHAFKSQLITANYCRLNVCLAFIGHWHFCLANIVPIEHFSVSFRHINCPMLSTLRSVFGTSTRFCHHFSQQFFFYLFLQYISLAFYLLISTFYRSTNDKNHIQNTTRFSAISPYKSAVSRLNV